ncbi:LOW QUALITY PROTEIN: sporulation sigma-E factor processing peptidase [Bacillus sp. JCM 19045]|nr:LOW QUALITY PROTEIN: sporulation sigma-E factor processing peptidase [Bacillus sp. JCM 19045]
MTVYLDLIWLLNVSIDYLLLAGTALLLRRKLQQFRLISGAFLASLVVFFMFSPYVTLFMNPLVKLLYSCLIVYITFGYKRFTYFIQSLFAFYFITFVTGGGLFAMHYFFQTEVDLLSLLPAHGLGGSAISWLFVVLGFPLIFLFSKQQVNHFQIKKMNSEQLAEVQIQIASATLSLTGLVDTGNQLKDPITKTPVMIIEASLLHPFLERKQEDIMKFTAEDESTLLMNRVRIIPFKAIGQNDRFIAALKPDQVTITHSDASFEVTNVLLGLYDEKLSSEDAFQCIVHPQLVIQSAG